MSRNDRVVLDSAVGTSGPREVDCSNVRSTVLGSDEPYSSYCAFWANQSWSDIWYGANDLEVLLMTPEVGPPLIDDSPDAASGLHLVDGNTVLRKLVGAVHNKSAPCRSSR